MSSSRLSAVVLSIGALILMGGCQQASTTHGDLTQGVWAGEGGVETFYWDISLVDSSYAGVIHTVRDGKKQTELPISRVTWQPPQLEMLMAATGVTYRGRVDFDKGRIDGQLFYGEDEGPPMELNLVDPHQVPGLSPRPTDLPYAYKQPPTTDDGLATASCRTMGMEPEAVGELVAEICSGRAGVIHSLLILAEGQLVVEEYFHGYDRESLHRLASVTKSVSSLLLGLAIDHGEVPGVEARLLDYFPELNRPTDDRWQAETIHHLLSMSMGLDYGPQEDPHGTGPGFFQQVLDREVTHDPGTHWAYQSANVNLLSGIINQATGKPVEQFAAAHLFEPLGITRHEWSYLADGDHRLMDGSLQLRPRDQAKLGLLLRNGGRWHGRQVVSSDWIEQSTRSQIATDGPETYGYLWWLGTFPCQSGPQPGIFANGHGSQFIAWLPGRDLVVVVNGGNEDNGKHFAIMKILAGVF